tara:strand:- start:347 stop:718 length:372 start_codon:yes stop_codon:yes gene_type:complete
MKLTIFIIGLILIYNPLLADGTDMDTFSCHEWTNAGLRMKGNIVMHISSERLEWENDKLKQTAVVVNPGDTYTGSQYSPMRIYLAEDRTAAYFVRRLLDLVHINRVKVTVNETKSNTTDCVPQ